MPYDEEPINFEEVARFHNLDEQIEQRLYQRLLPPDRGEVLDPEMLRDLYNYYDPDAQRFQHALHRVRERLGGRGVAPLYQQHQRRNGPGTRPGFRQKRQDLMLRIFRTGQHWSARAITLVAVVLLIVLVGGLALGLMLVHQTHSGAPGVPKNHATGTVTTRPQQPRAFHEFPLPSPPPGFCNANCGPIGITSGPDGNLWFGGSPQNLVGRITPAGQVQEFTLPTPLPTACGGSSTCGPLNITSGPDGNLWFTESFVDKIGRITPAGQIQEFSLPTTCGGSGCNPQDITSGPDGNLWFTELSGNKIGRITPAGQIQEFALPIACEGNSCAPAITSGPDGNLWFTSSGGLIGRITPAGQIQEFAPPTVCGSNCYLNDITSGHDGHLWFTESGGDAIGEVSP